MNLKADWLIPKMVDLDQETPLPATVMEVSIGDYWH